MANYNKFRFRAKSIIFLVTLMLTANANNGPISDNITNHKADFENLAPKNVFKVHPTIAGSFQSQTGGELVGGTLLDKAPKIAGMATESEEEVDEYMVFAIPMDRGDEMILHLYRTRIYADDAHVCTSAEDTKDCPLAGQGQHYWGIVADHPDDSLASCSFSDYEVACVIQLGEDQYVLGNLDGSNSEVFYNTKELEFTPAYEHEFIMEEQPEEENEEKKEPPKRTPPKLSNTLDYDSTWTETTAIYIHFDVEYSIYEHYGRDEARVRAWVESTVAEVFILFANNGVTLKLNSIRIWTEEDPYSGQNMANFKLTVFSSEMSHNAPFPADLYHLLSFTYSGGIAWLNGLCSWQNQALSGLSAAEAVAAPTYSWNTKVIAHELGHNLGSPHTHACAWGPNGDEPIDCCGGCQCATSATDAPVGGGTIMSYCHLFWYVNFNNGFGPEPTALIQNNVANASCLTDERRCKKWPDKDGDGAGAQIESEAIIDCRPSVPGFVGVGHYMAFDCDDSDPTRYYGAPCIDPDQCESSLDYDCNCWVVYDMFKTVYYRDEDGDGFGVNDHTIKRCDAQAPTEAEWVTQGDDCDDEDPENYPGAYCDAGQQCAGQKNTNCQCDDAPGANRTKYYLDQDGDSHGNPYEWIEACYIPDGYVESNDDCNDHDEAKWIGVPCVGDGECSGALNEHCDCHSDMDRKMYYIDNDNDGYGSPHHSEEACVQPAGFVENSLDCNDNDEAFWTTGPCHDKDTAWDGVIDDQCQCNTDDNPSKVAYYPDEDGDGYGGYYNEVLSCTGPPEKHVDNHMDCDNWEPTVWIGASCDMTTTYWSRFNYQGCEGAGEGCACEVSDWCSCELVPGNVSKVYCKDEDDDGYGTGNDWKESCSQPAGYVENCDDCNDSNADIYDGAACVAGGGCAGNINQYCDCQMAEGVQPQTFYADNDNDTHGDPTQSTQACTAPTGYVDNSNDCNDSDSSLFIGGDCTSSDNSSACDNGKIDLACQCIIANLTTYYQDSDADGYGNPNLSLETCFEAPENYVDNYLDCEDSDPSKWTTAPCDDGSECTTELNESCLCSTNDADNDGICDGLDQCPDEDDTIDINHDGLPDCAFEPCAEHTSMFDKNVLSTSTMHKTDSATVTFTIPARNPEFTVLNVGSQVDKYEELVKIYYVKTTGEQIFHGEMTWNELKEINEGSPRDTKNDWSVLIEDRDIKSVSVYLMNAVHDSRYRTRINLSDVKYCGEFQPDGESLLLEMKGKQAVSNDL